MMAKNNVRGVLVLAALGLIPSVASADEIVHFTNGAEMTVRSHTVEKEMVRLDLGGSSFIAFPMAMVDKIVSAGRDVFLNPSIHPANQAVAGVASGSPAGSPGTGSIIADTAMRGGGAPVGFARQSGTKGGAGTMLGEAADMVPTDSRTDPSGAYAVANRRRNFNPAFPVQPGSMPQVIVPPSAPRSPARLSVVAPRSPDPQPPPPPPVSEGTPDNPPQADPPPEDPPDTP